MVGTNGVYSHDAVNHAASTNETGRTGKTANYGKTVGEPKLSDEAAKYYEELKKKYSNMDFVLVSKDMKETAKANAASFANPSKMVVLIDEEKIEKMATDENYRKQYEGIIANSASGMSQLQSSLANSGANVKGYGMQVNDNGTASYFAVLEKSSAAQRERIEKHAAEKKAEKRAEDKKAAKKAEEERINKHRNHADKVDGSEDDTVTITANSLDELLQKISDFNLTEKESYARTDAEKKVGQSIDYFG